MCIAVATENDDIYYKKKIIKNTDSRYSNSKMKENYKTLNSPYTTLKLDLFSFNYGVQPCC